MHKAVSESITRYREFEGHEGMGHSSQLYYKDAVSKSSPMVTHYRYDTEWRGGMAGMAGMQMIEDATRRRMIISGMISSIVNWSADVMCFT